MRKSKPNQDRSRIPLYAQLASVMRQRIEKGQWKHGQKISTLEELEVEFSVARITIRQAIDILRDEGLLTAQQGRGTFVTGTPKYHRALNLSDNLETLAASLKDNLVKIVHIDEHAEPPVLSEGEGYPSPDYVFLRSVQYNQKSPISVVNLHLDGSLFRSDRKSFRQSAALPKVLEMLGGQLADAFQTITIGVADPETAQFLEVGLGEPTADARLVVVDERGRAVYVADIHYQRDFFALRSNLLAKSERKPKATRPPTKIKAPRPRPSDPRHTRPLA